MPETGNQVKPLLQPEATPLVALERRVGNLIRAYLKKRCPVTAQSVVRNLEWLLRHPDARSDSTQGFAYLRLRHHWRMLAAIDGKAGTRGG